MASERLIAGGGETGITIGGSGPRYLPMQSEPSPATHSQPSSATGTSSTVAIVMSSFFSFNLSGPEPTRIFNELPMATIALVSRPDAGDISPLLLSGINLVKETVGCRMWHTNNRPTRVCIVVSCDFPRTSPGSLRGLCISCQFHAPVANLPVAVFVATSWLPTAKWTDNTGFYQPQLSPLPSHRILIGEGYGNTI